MAASQFALLSPDVLVEVLSCITYNSSQLAWFGSLCRSVADTLGQDAAWRHLCRRYWYATEDRIREWPSLSPQGLYRALEQWAPLEGYYVLTPAFPWGLLALVRIVEGRVLADVIRFIPKPDGSFVEVFVPLFRVTLKEDCPGILRSALDAPWSGGAEGHLSALDPLQLCASTVHAKEFSSRNIARDRLFTARRALRITASKQRKANAAASTAASSSAQVAAGAGDRGAEEAAAPQASFLARMSAEDSSGRVAGWDMEWVRAEARQILLGRIVLPFASLVGGARSAAAGLATLRAGGSAPAAADGTMAADGTAAADGTMVVDGAVAADSTMAADGAAAAEGPVAAAEDAATDSAEDEDEGSDGDDDFRHWGPARLFETPEEAKEKTEAMLRFLFGTQSVPCDLALIRSPADHCPQDASCPGIRPGLYVGDYGHDAYGQFRTEVLLLEYATFEPANLRQEAGKTLFARPAGEPAPVALSLLEDMTSPVTLVRGVKQCGDVHVPMGSTTFVAVCGPPEASAALAEGRPHPRAVLNRQSNQDEAVQRAWRGFGTLAVVGFCAPSWAGGWLVQLEDDASTGDHRFGFVWDRSQDAVVLRWIAAQDTSPFLQRTWLPEDLQ